MGVQHRCLSQWPSAHRPEVQGRHFLSAHQRRLTSGSSQSLGGLANPDGLPLAYRALTGEVEAVELKCVVVLSLRRTPEKEDFCSVRSTQAPLFLLRLGVAEYGRSECGGARLSVSSRLPCRGKLGCPNSWGGYLLSITAGFKSASLTLMRSRKFSALGFPEEHKAQRQAGSHLGVPSSCREQLSSFLF